MLVKLTTGVNVINVFEQLFCMKVFCATFLYLQFGIVIFWQDDFVEKAARKMLIKLVPVVLQVDRRQKMKKLVATSDFYYKLGLHF
jgi:hypothetical protein